MRGNRAEGVGPERTIGQNHSNSRGLPRGTRYATTSIDNPNSVCGVRLKTERYEASKTSRVSRTGSPGSEQPTPRGRAGRWNGHPADGLRSAADTRPTGPDSLCRRHADSRPRALFRRVWHQLRLGCAVARNSQNRAGFHRLVSNTPNHISTEG